MHSPISLLIVTILIILPSENYGSTRNDLNNNAAINVHSNHGSLIGKLETLIENFTFVMHLPTDFELYTYTVLEFKSTLVQLIHDNTTEPYPGYLLHQAIYGVFRLRNHAIKDDLVSGRRVTIRQYQFDTITPWKLDLLEFILRSNTTRMDSNTSSENGTPLELSVKLQLLSAANLLVHHGASVCYSYSSPLICSAAIQYAVINNNIPAIDFIVKTFLEEVRVFSREPVNSTEVLIPFFSHSWNMKYSAMDIACIHCVSGVSCQALSHLMSYISNCNFVCKPVNRLHQVTIQPTCKRVDTFPRGSLHSVDHNGMTTRTEMSVRQLFESGFSRYQSGWSVYDGFSIGEDGCALPRVRAESLHHQLFEELFVNLSIPVVIEGMADNWKLSDVWSKRNLLEKWSHLDLLVGPILYGEVFGEKHGYATVEEFISYMDDYASHPVIDKMAEVTPEYPLYVFDNQVLRHHFVEDYNITFFMDIPTWRSATHIYQFILGPVGSGAPFHFHCNAVNALIHGRKKWFLYPPGSAIYSKEHPLKWYQKYGSQMTLTDKPIECIQRAGDIIYVPSQWTHATINLDECIGLAVEFDSGTC